LVNKTLKERSLHSLCMLQHSRYTLQLAYKWAAVYASTTYSN